MFQHGQTGYNWLIRLLYFFLFLLAAFGLGFLILGGVIHRKFTDQQTYVGDSLTGAAIVIIIVGLVIFAIATFGCLSTKKESVCMLFMFLGLVISILIMEFSCGIAGYALRGPIADRISATILKDINIYPNSSTTLDPMQGAFVCCGSDGPSSWNTSKFLNQTNGIFYPASCCYSPYDKNETCINNSTMIKEDGCVEKMQAWAAYNGGTFGGVIIAFSFIEIVGLVLTCYVTKKIRDQYTF